MLASKNLRILAALGTVSGALWAGTFATFTDQAASTSTFSAGTLDLVAGGATNDAHALTTLSMSNMKPGDKSYASVAMENVGSLDFTYDMLASAADGTPTGLGAALTVAVKQLGVTGVCSAAGWATAGLDALTATALPGAGFTGRTLTKADATATTDTETLCFEVAFPSTAADQDPLQGASTTATFTFTATQV